MAEKAVTSSTPSKRKPAGNFDKALFLEHLSEHGHVARAAAHTGCERNTAYKWKWKDDKFAKQWVAAMVKARKAWADELEGILKDKVFNGWTETQITRVAGNIVTEKATRKFSPTLIIFMIKNIMKEQYGEVIVQGSAPEDAARAIREFLKQAKSTVEPDDNAGDNDASDDAKPK